MMARAPSLRRGASCSCEASLDVTKHNARVKSSCALTHISSAELDSRRRTERRQARGRRNTSMRGYTVSVRATGPPLEREASQSGDETGGKGGGAKRRAANDAFFREHWDGSKHWDSDKYDMSVKGMWDKDVSEGPSCIRIPPIERASVDELETLYAQAKSTYFNGHPLVADKMFDTIEERLRFFGSDLVKKYPRCSRRGMRVYADAASDNEQMRLLAATWLSFVLLGFGFVYMDFGDAIKASIGFGAATAKFRVPVMGLLGVFLASSAGQKLVGMKAGSVVALTGECPNCNNQVYTYVPALKGDARVKTECHVCGRGLVFQASIRKSKSSFWNRAAHGRIYLVSRNDDYRIGPEDSTDIWPPSPDES